MVDDANLFRGDDDETCVETHLRTIGLCALGGRRDRAEPVGHGAWNGRAAVGNLHHLRRCPIDSLRREKRRRQGAIAGGVLGGVLGHQIGSGRGNTAATIVGAGAGAYAGNEVERNTKKKSYYAVAVRLDNGRMRTITQGARPGVREGDRVKIVGGNRLALIAS